MEIGHQNGRKATEREAVVAIPAVRRVDIGAIKVEVARVGRIPRATRPVVRVVTGVVQSTTRIYSPATYGMLGIEMPLRISGGRGRAKPIFSLRRHWGRRRRGSHDLQRGTLAKLELDLVRFRGRPMGNSPWLYYGIVWGGGIKTGDNVIRTCQSGRFLVQ